MARTKQTARKSTGGQAPTIHLHNLPIPSYRNLRGEPSEMIPCANGTLWQCIGDGEQKEVMEIFKKVKITIETTMNCIFLSNDKKLYSTIQKHEHWEPCPEMEGISIFQKPILKVLPVHKESAWIIRLDDKKWYKLDRRTFGLTELMGKDCYENCLAYDCLQHSDWGDCDLQIAIFDNHVYFQDDGDKEWQHIPFFDDKNPTNAVVTLECGYVQCNDELYVFTYPHKRVMFHPPKRNEEEEEEEEYEQEEQQEEEQETVMYPSVVYTAPKNEEKMEYKMPLTISAFDFFKGRKIHKILSFEMTFFCWCDEKIFVWGERWPDVNSDQIMVELGNPIHFFNDKCVLDIGKCSENLLVLTSEGVYSFTAVAQCDPVDRTIRKLDGFSLEGNLPNVFSFYIQQKRFNQKKRAFQPTVEQDAEHPQKKQATEANIVTE